ncbi:odorant receptor coreceptor-like [Leptopilina heterotoma]|uniref:odorant receptor coreceptor-like n=1 Tax=Leptopilina heterotoma TaxID=63436 RepID=UPI001CA93EAE|nr:odorant receptor coreceptor-like [Leptopilina heterotoma]
MGPYMIFLLYPILTKSLSRKTATTMQFIFPVKNFFNIQNYYYYLLAMTYCGTISIITTFVAFDTIFATFIQQACGMFAILIFSDLLNSAFSFGLLISTTLNTVLLSFTVFSAREYHHTPLLMWRYAILTSAEIFHLFNKFWQCQTLIDHSVMFRNSIYASNWYNASANTKLILRFMLMRSEKVCKVTAGKFFDMSFHTFRKILSTAASYFTVLSAIK